MDLFRIGPHNLGAKFAFKIRGWICRWHSPRKGIQFRPSGDHCKMSPVPWHSPTLFAPLPLLDRIASQVPGPQASLDGVTLVCVQHLLETSGSLIQTLVSLGLNPSNLHVLGKAYSSNS